MCSSVCISHYKSLLISASNLFLERKLMDTLLQLSDLLLHIDRHLDVVISQYGPWAYGLLFAIVFAETGLVVAPFLPGDSLLFIAGAYCATEHFNIWTLCIGLLVAAVSGNTVNYFIGRWIGKKVFSSKSRWIDQSALLKTHAFYEKHGGKTIGHGHHRRRHPAYAGRNRRSASRSASWRRCAGNRCSGAARAAPASPPPANA